MTPEELAAAEVKRFQGFYPRTKEAYLRELGQMSLGLAGVSPKIRKTAALILKQLHLNNKTQQRTS